MNTTIYKTGPEVWWEQNCKRDCGLECMSAADLQKMPDFGQDPSLPSFLREDRVLYEALEMIADREQEDYRLDEVRKCDLAYGYWECKDGRVVAFNRSYQPLWSKLPGGRWEPANRDEWVDNIRHDRRGEEAGRMFYGDLTPTRLKIGKARRGMIEIGLLAEWEAEDALAADDRRQRQWRAAS